MVKLATQNINCGDLQGQLFRPAELSDRPSSLPISRLRRAASPGSSIGFFLNQRKDYE